MAGFLIFVPAQPQQYSDILADVGLGDLRRDVAPDITPVLQGGPDGNGGILLSWINPDDPFSGIRPVVDMKRQEWTPCKANKALGLEAGRFWMGRERDRPILPGDIQRREMVPGIEVELGDGNKWVVPVASAVPQAYCLDDNGEWVGRPVPAYREFCDRCQAVRDQLDTQSGDTIAISDGLDFVTYVLGVNYRLSSDLIDWLGLIDEKSFFNLIGAPLGMLAIPAEAQSSADLV